jgi:hypothetical protein
LGKLKPRKKLGRFFFLGIKEGKGRERERKEKKKKRKERERKRAKGKRKFFFKYKHVCPPDPWAVTKKNFLSFKTPD